MLTLPSDPVPATQATCLWSVCSAAAPTAAHQLGGRRGAPQQVLVRVKESWPGRPGSEGLVNLGCLEALCEKLVTSSSPLIVHLFAMLRLNLNQLLLPKILVLWHLYSLAAQSVWCSPHRVGATPHLPSPISAKPSAPPGAS